MNPVFSMTFSSNLQPVHDGFDGGGDCRIGDP